MGFLKKKAPHEKYPEILEWNVGDELSDGTIYVCVTGDCKLIAKREDRLIERDLWCTFVYGTPYNVSHYQRRLGEKISKDDYCIFLEEVQKQYKELNIRNINTSQ